MKQNNLQLPIKFKWTNELLKDLVTASKPQFSKLDLTDIKLPFQIPVRVSKYLLSVSVFIFS
jgi:hypothetical protein